MSLTLLLSLTSALAIQSVFPGCAHKEIAQPQVASSPSPSPSTSTSAAMAPNDTESPLLSASLRDQLTGLSLESPESREQFNQQAQRLIALRRHKVPTRERRKWLIECAKTSPNAPAATAFCRLANKYSGSNGPQRKNRRSTSKTSSRTIQKLSRAMREGRTDLLKGATDHELMVTLKKIKDPFMVRPLMEKALDSHQCVSPSLIAALGFKSEEAFPNPDYRELTMALYQRATECGPLDPITVKGVYRLGLLQIWDNQCDLAEKSLAKITDHPDAADFRSRVLYWRQLCAKQRNDFALRDQLKAELAKDHPLSLHNLIMTSASALSLTPPRILFKSTLNPALNADLRLAEALQRQAAPEISVDALEPVLDQLKGMEPEFQLYIGLLLTRATESLHKFKLLSGLFRDYPGLIARESLELLFPLYRFEIVRHYENQADPYLMISLIRQESAFNDRAKSRVGAMGLMQLMPKTARRMEKTTRRALFDANTNIRIGIRFFSRLNERYGGESDLALAAYNAGPEKVDLWKQRYPVENRLLFLDLIPFKETREYVASIARNYYFYKRLYTSEDTPKPSITPTSIPLATPAATTPKALPPNLEKFNVFKLFNT